MLKQKNITFYTIFLGDELWEDCVDDMNTVENWAYAGKLWKDKKMAIACVKNLKRYDFEKSNKEKFKIIKVSVISSSSTLLIKKQIYKRPPEKPKKFKRDIKKEKRFIRNWKCGEEIEKPTLKEINIGVYGIKNPKFIN